jgi:hypothetical protein
MKWAAPIERGGGECWLPNMLAFKFYLSRLKILTL